MNWMQMGETIHSPAPWDLPLWDPSHVVFLVCFMRCLLRLALVWLLFIAVR